MKTTFIVAAGLVIAAFSSAGAYAEAEIKPATDSTTTDIVGEVGGPEITGNTAGGFTLDTVSPDKPFAELDVDPRASRDEANARLTLAEREELLGRCAVVVANDVHYEAAVTTFCSAYSAPQ